MHRITHRHASKASRGLQKAWTQIDTDGDGALDRDELISLLRLVGHNQEEADELLKRSWETIDTDHDELINFEEFQTWWDDYILQKLKEAKLLELKLTVKNLGVELQGSNGLDDFDGVSVKLQNLVATMDEQMLDRKVNVHLAELSIEDCEQSSLGRPDRVLQVQDASVKLVNAERGSSNAAVEGQSSSATDAEVGSLRVAVRLELINTLSALITRTASAVAESLMSSPQQRMVQQKEKDLSVAKAALDTAAAQLHWDHLGASKDERDMERARVKEATQQFEYAKARLANARRMLRESEHADTSAQATPARPVDQSCVNLHLKSAEAALLPSSSARSADALIVASIANVEAGMTAKAKSVSTDLVIEDVSITMPVDGTAGGVSGEISKIQLKVASEEHEEDLSRLSIQLDTLALHHYIGGHVYVQRGIPAVEHPLLFARPVDLSIEMESCDLRQKVDMKLPACTYMALSFRDLRLLGKVVASTNALMSQPVSTGQEFDSDVFEPEPEPEPEPELEPEPGDLNTTSELVFNLIEDAEFAVIICDDVLGRDRARQVLSLMVQLNSFNLNASTAGLSGRLSVGLAIDHFDDHHAASPVLEPCKATISIENDTDQTGGKVIDVGIEPRVELVCTESALIDAKHLKFLWKNKWDDQDTEEDNTAPYVCVRNETGEQVKFDTPGDSSDTALEMTVPPFEEQELENVLHEHSTHSHVKRRRATEILHVDMNVSVGSHSFSAPLSHSTAWYSADEQTFITCGIHKQGSCTTMNLAGPYSVRNGLTGKISVTVGEYPTVTVPAGETRGLPIAVTSADPIMISYAEDPDNSMVRTFCSIVGVMPGINTGRYVRAAQGDSCLRIVASKHRLCCRPISNTEGVEGLVWIDALQLEVHPALVIANMLPMALTLRYRSGQETDTLSTTTVGAGDMLEVDLHVPEEDVFGSVECEINGKLFRSPEEVQLTGEATESLLLTTDDGLPHIELQLLHDTTDTGVRAVRVIASHWLVNSSGLPIEVFQDNDDAMPVARSVTKALDPEKVKDWILRTDDATIFSIQDDLVTIGVHGGRA